MKFIILQGFNQEKWYLVYKRLNKWDFTRINYGFRWIPYYNQEKGNVAGQTWGFNLKQGNR